MMFSLLTKAPETPEIVETLKILVKNIDVLELDTLTFVTIHDDRFGAWYGSTTKGKGIWIFNKTDYLINSFVPDTIIETIYTL